MAERARFSQAMNVVCLREPFTINNEAGCRNGNVVDIRRGMGQKQREPFQKTPARVDSRIRMKLSRLKIFLANWKQFGAGVCLASGCCLALSIPPAARAEELRTVAAIRALTVAQTQQKIPVRLHGVVTFFDENLYSRFLQDDTAGIYFQFPANIAPPLLAPGQSVEIAGAASPGEYAPVVMVSKVTVTGEASLPAAKPVTYEQLASGTEDSQFVEICGIVRSVRKVEAPKYFQIEIATGGGRLLVFAKKLR